MAVGTDRCELPGLRQLLPVGGDLEGSLGFGVVWIYRQRPLELGDGLVHTPVPQERIPEIVTCIDGIGADLQGSPEAGDGLVDLAPRKECGAEVILGVGISGPDVHGPPKLVDGLVQLPGPLENAAEPQAGLEVGGLAPGGPLGLGNRFTSEENNS